MKGGFDGSDETSAGLDGAKSTTIGAAVVVEVGLVNVNLRFVGGQSSSILDCGGGLLTGDKVMSMISGDLGVKSFAMLVEWNIRTVD